MITASASSPRPGTVCLSSSCWTHTRDNLCCCREKLRLKEVEYETVRSNMELKDSEELRQLEAAWRSLADLTASWEQEMRQTDQLATRLEDKLTEVENGLKQLELASLEWDLPPSLGEPD